MSEFHLHARKGWYETQTAEVVDYKSTVADAARFMSMGYHVWIFRHQHGVRVAAADPKEYRVVAEGRPFSELIEYGARGLPWAVGWKRDPDTVLPTLPRSIVWVA